MKLSTFGLSLAVAASSLVGISSFSQSATAATIGAENGSFIFEGIWEFSFVSSFGDYQSTFGIGSNPLETTPLFAEQNQSSPSVVLPGSSVAYTFTGSETDFFLSTSVPNSVSTIFSTNAHSVTPTGGFLITSDVDGSRLIKINDSFPGDRDFNDFVVKAKPVPVPAIVPGIALAAAFFGSKALKRNKKEASESVA